MSQADNSWEIIYQVKIEGRNCSRSFQHYRRVRKEMPVVLLAQKQRIKKQMDFISDATQFNP